MSILYARRMFAMIVIAFLFGVGFLDEVRVFAFEGNRIWFYAVAFLIAAALVHWVSASPEVEGDAGSRRRVEKVLRELKDKDLDLLRSRLMNEVHDDEYGSMADLMQSSKRKNEA